MKISQNLNKEEVTVIIPVYNRRNLVERSLDSVFNQTYRPLTLIIVDNNSTDGSLEVVKHWANIHEAPGFRIEVLKESYQSAAAARQKGLDNTKTDKVVFLDSDDSMHSDLLEKAMTKFYNNPNLDIVAWKANIYDSGKLIRTTKVSEKKYLRTHIVSTMFCTVSNMTKVSYLQAVGGWNRKLKVWDDYELWFRVCLNNPAVGIINEVLIDVFHQSNSITGDDFHSKCGQWENVLSVMESEINNWTKDEKIKIHLFKWIVYRYVILAAHYYREGYKNIGIELFNRITQSRYLSKVDIFRLKVIYDYTRLGGRGAHYFWSLK